ncbi:MAG: M81 family metallopeptidase [Kordiimonadaceae bacterium]|nr:M81 family metallopeptidase [Kordiimonadaceae bacterium]
MRVAVAGYQHETNSFVSEKTGYDAFVQPDAWPGLLRGPAVISQTYGCNLPMAGFLAEADTLGWSIEPVLWCSAGPSGIVSSDAYVRICSAILEGVKALSPVDAVYLDLHGAMVAEGAADADGDLIRRVRDLVGPSVVIVASLDFHANVSDQMVAHSDRLVMYRTYPHVDMADTGKRAAKSLAQILMHGAPKAVRQQLPFLIPMSAQSTLDMAMADVVKEIEEIESRGGTVEFAAGFPLADVAECVPSVVAYGSYATTSAEEMVALLTQLENKFKEKLLQPAQAITQALEQITGDVTGPVILVDTQDNPGCGGTGDTVGLLAALVEADVEGAVLGVLCDPVTSAQAHAAGVGAVLDVRLGAQHGYGERPLEVPARVEALGDGCFVGTGPFYLGCHFDLGPMAVLSIGKVKVVISHARQQAADQAMFRHVGIEPAEASMLALKSTVHYRADFGAIASGHLMVESPGANIADLSTLAYHHIGPEKRVAGGPSVARA